METEKKIVSLEYLQEIADGNKEFIKEMIEVFLNTLPSEMTLIRDHFNNKDFESLKGVAHKLKANFKYFDADRPYEIVSYIERCVHEGEKFETFEANISELEEFSEKILLELRELL